MKTICLTIGEYQNLKFGDTLYFLDGLVVAKVTVADDQPGWGQTVNVRIKDILSESEPNTDLIAATREQLYKRDPRPS